MALNIKNTEVEKLAAEVAVLADESKTEAIRQSLLERRSRLQLRSPATRLERLEALLERRIWPAIPKQVIGKRITKRDRERILGYGPHGF